MKKFTFAAKECGNFIAQWWQDRDEFRDGYGGMRWHDCKIMSIVCGHEGPGYGSWRQVPLSTRLHVNLRGWLLNRLSPRAEDRVLWFFGFFHVLAVARCAISGHLIVDESYGGPDSGCVAGTCSRCGWGFRTVLY